MISCTPPILLVEDNPDDAFLMVRALKKAGVNHPLHLVTTGQMALDYLQGHGNYSNRAQFPLPFIVFLDLKLPYIHGFDLLSWIRQHPPTASLPVIVLTSSNEPKDRQRAQTLGAHHYLVKAPTPQILKDLFASFPNA
jgi:CheY-like chemotaxis protein